MERTRDEGHNGLVCAAGLDEFSCLLLCRAPNLANEDDALRLRTSVASTLDAQFYNILETTWSTTPKLGEAYGSSYQLHTAKL